MNEHLTALFEGLELSEETKTKVNTIFETAVKEEVSKQEEALVEKYELAAKEYSEYALSEMEDLTKDYINEELVPTVNKYIEYSMEEFIKENEIPTQNKLKVELAESMLKGLVSLAEAHSVKLPESQEVVKVLEEKISKMDSRFEKVLTESDTLKTTISNMKKEKIVEGVVESLTESEKEKFNKVVTEVAFVNESQYEDAVKDLYESYFPRNDKNKNKKLDESIKIEKTGDGGAKQSYYDMLVDAL